MLDLSESDNAAVRPRPDPSGPAAGEFTRLVGRHRSACLVLARRVLRDPQMAEDAVQEAFLDAWRQPTRYDALRSTELGWLLTLTHRRAVDRVRREERHGAVLPPVAAAADAVLVDAPDEQVWRAERARSLRLALRDLTQEQCEVLVLAYFGGLTQREIAGHVGIPLGTVKTRTVAAMRRLAPVLRDAGVDTG